ncbi:MAG: 2-hydroxy-3-oxopropionate reductase [Deltaproteobacteria bacterium]|nr:2-hydroxy-3-oxopropionate reductase [Deltaproteobacteria bacterium]
MSERVTKVGFIGLGRMGKPIASNVLNDGFELTVYDLRDAAVGELTRLGAKAATSPRNVAKEAEIVELAVVDDGQVENVLTGEQGVFAGARPGTIVAIHSTVLPETVCRLAEVGKKIGVQVIDAPVSGGETGAREQSLCYMVGGDVAAMERCRAVFSTSASEIFHMGELGSGAVAKIIVQVVTCINMLAAHEAQCVAEKTGLNFAALQQVLHSSSARSFVMDNWLDRFKLAGDPMEIRHRRTEVFQKSLAPALELAERLGLSLAGTTLAERLLPRIMGIEDDS